ncbi:DUF1398 family protein [Kribbella sp. NPDC056951]|uniref:DUF1398 family protein n=1 Tax=Kribbella sp. NPDC056951 TaxID=3345978 RepID=UPI00363F218C
MATEPTHAVFTVAAEADKDAMAEQLRLHETGVTSYVEMSRGLAEAGVEKWIFDTGALTIAYYDRAGNVLLSEQI